MKGQKPVAVLWKAIVDKSSQDPVFRITSPDVIPSSNMQIHPLRINIDLLRFVLVGQEFFLTGQEFFHQPRMF